MPPTGWSSKRVVTAAVAYVALVSAGAWAVLDATDGAGSAPRGYRVFTLADGATAVAIGTRHEGVLETRWRDSDGHWSSHGHEVRVPQAGLAEDVEGVTAGPTVAAHVLLRGPLDDATGEPAGPPREASSPAPTAAARSTSTQQASRPCCDRS